MATNAGETTTEYLAGRLQELGKENSQLRRELQSMRAERDVARGVAQSAMAERVAAQKLTGRITAEEHATQRAIGEQSSNFTYVNVMLLLIFVTSLLGLLAMFIWLPNQMANSRAASGPTTTVSAPYAPVR